MLLLAISNDVESLVFNRPQHVAFRSLGSRSGLSKIVSPRIYVLFLGLALHHIDDHLAGCASDLVVG